MWKMYFVLSDQLAPDLRANAVLTTPAGVWLHKAAVASNPKTLGSRCWLRERHLLNCGSLLGSWPLVLDSSVGADLQEHLQLTRGPWGGHLPCHSGRSLHISNIRRL